MSKSPDGPGPVEDVAAFVIVMRSAKEPEEFVSEPAADISDMLKYHLPLERFQTNKEAHR
jgi:hypothetical protein